MNFTRLEQILSSPEDLCWLVESFYLLQHLNSVSNGVYIVVVLSILTDYVTCDVIIYAAKCVWHQTLVVWAETSLNLLPLTLSFIN